MSTALVLVWRSTRVINFAQAGQAVFTTYIGYEVTTRSGSYWIGVAAAIISGAVIGAVIDRFFMRPIFKRIKSGPIVMIAPVVATLGLLGIIQAIIGAAAGALGAYIAIRADLADLKARMTNVERATDSAQTRIDKILHRE
jgi:branched-chain amino acid transport system permease protein